MKVLHLLASNKYSGAENVVCQIIKMFENDIEMAYCSPCGLIEKTLNESNIKFFGIKKLATKHLSKVIEEFRPDIIHAHDIRASIIASKFSKKINVISHIHGNDKKNMGKITPKSIMFKWAAKNINHIFWVSNSCLNDYVFKKSIINKSTILYNIINTKNLYSKVMLDKNDYTYDICYLGRLEDVKNPLRMLHIIRDIKTVYNEIRCAVVGDGSLKKECIEFVNSNNLKNNVDFFGFVSNPYKILKSSKVMLMSSINEGTPMAVLEAFALGVPVVSTYTDGTVDLLNKNYMGALYNTNDEAVKSILEIIKKQNNSSKEELLQFSEKHNDIKTYKSILYKVYLKDEKTK